VFFDSGPNRPEINPFGITKTAMYRKMWF